MPLTSDDSHIAASDPQYFSALKDLDIWATRPAKKLEGILEYVPRAPLNEPRTKGKLLVCHDYKGGYTEKPTSLSYTFNFWSSCDVFIYFSHHRITIPPPGWITAAHRQGVKMLGTLIFEGHDGGEEDCLRLLVGNLPTSINGPAKSSAPTSSLPLSPHYARLLADLAQQRGFDGYLLNFECPLRGGLEQTRTLAAWITLLQTEIQSKVGSHGEIIWYDSVIFTGQLAWQDRLNSLNLPFFLSSTSIFTNYTWQRDYPDRTAQYFLTLDPALTGNASNSLPLAKKSLNDIYMGVDVWGRGSHGGGGFGSYKAITHIAPESLGLSVALFGQAWTWESEQDKAGWNWDRWWAYESKLWTGPVSGTVDVPEAPRRKGEPDCVHGPFLPINSFFPHNTPPDPFSLPLHTTFCPGVGRAWFVNGAKVHQSDNGWTDIDKQCTVGDMVWPRPAVEWEGGEREDKVPDALSAIDMEDAWNGGSSLRLTLSAPGSHAEDDMYRCVWMPIQSLSLGRGKIYEATVIYKVEVGADISEVGLSAKPTAGIDDFLEVTSVGEIESAGRDWMKLTIRVSTSDDKDVPASITAGIGLVIAIVTEDPSQPLDFSILLGQLNVFPATPESAAPHTPKVLWADFTPTNKQTPNSPLSGLLTWETAASFPALTTINVTSPEDPVSAWTLQPLTTWFPTFIYFNIYSLHYSRSGKSHDEKVGQPEDASWIGTTGWDGKRNMFTVVQESLPLAHRSGKVRFYVQGITDRGVVLSWDRCVYVDYDPSIIRKGS